MVFWLRRRIFRRGKRKSSTICGASCLFSLIFLDAGATTPSENHNFQHVTAAAGKLHLTVEAVSDAEVRLCLDGFANLHNPLTGLKTYLSPGVKEHSKNLRIPLDYDPKLLGYLSHHSAKKVLTRLA